MTRPPSIATLFRRLNQAQADRITDLEAENAKLREALEEVETYFDARELTAWQHLPDELRLLVAVREALNGGPCL